MHERAASARTPLPENRPGEEALTKKNKRSKRISNNLNKVPHQCSRADYRLLWVISTDAVLTGPTSRRPLCSLYSETSQTPCPIHLPRTLPPNGTSLRRSLRRKALGGTLPSMRMMTSSTLACQHLDNVGRQFLSLEKRCLWNSRILSGI